MNLTQMNMMYDRDSGKMVQAYKINDQGKKVRATIALINQNDPRDRQGLNRAKKGFYSPLAKRAYHDADAVPGRNELYPSIVTGRYSGR